MNRFRHREFVWRFLISGASVVIIVLCAAVLMFPRQPTLGEMLQALMSNGKKQGPWWERWLSSGRPNPEHRRQPGWWRQQKDQSVAYGTNPAGGGGAAHPAFAEKQHLALRETVLAQSVLSQRFAVSEEDAWRTVRSSTGQGDYRDYEENRFFTEVLWMRHQDRIEPQKALADLRRRSMAMLKSPYANFEDELNAGISALLSGAALQARPHLQTALDEWPARERMRGNAYLALLICDAVLGNWPAVAERLALFKANFPDWLFVETYLPDFDDLERAYPGQGAVLLVKGRLLQIVHDDAAAAVAYRAAHRVGGLESAAARQLDEWLADAQEAAP